MTQLSALPVTTKKISDKTTKVVVGASRFCSKTDDGVFVLLPAVDFDRFVEVTGITTEEQANNTGAQTQYKVGQGDDDDKFATHANLFSGNPAGYQVVAAQGSLAPGNGFGILSANQPLIVTVTPAVGDGTGECHIAVKAW